MSKIEVNTIEPQSGTTVTLGASGDTTNIIGTLNKDGVSVTNTPAFHAYVSSDQTLVNNTTTVVAFDTETFDTNSCYNTSNYRFTPNVAGKYSFSFCVNLKNTNGVYYMNVDLRKNGSNVASSRGPVFENSSSSDQSLEMVPLVQTILMDMNGSSDYVDVVAYFYNNGNGVIDGERTFINGFKILE
jgi:hypothetical protein